MRSFDLSRAKPGTLQPFPALTGRYSVSVVFQKLRDFHQFSAQALVGPHPVAVGRERLYHLLVQFLTLDLVERRVSKNLFRHLDWVQHSGEPGTQPESSDAEGRRDRSVSSPTVIILVNVFSSQKLDALACLDSCNPLRRGRIKLSPQFVSDSPGQKPSEENGVRDGAIED
jgi:hypothetical protein